jgi:hypothetical protein
MTRTIDRAEELVAQSEQVSTLVKDEIGAPGPARPQLTRAGRG